MIKTVINLLVLIGLSAQCLAQYDEDRYEYWREDAQLTYDMFQADTSTMSKYKEYNFKSIVSTGLWGALDIPKKKRDRRIKMEMYYFCAALDKTESCLFEKNEMSLNHAKLLWDICELATRVSRKNLSDMLLQADSIGYQTLMTSKGIKVFNHDTLTQFHITGMITLYYMTALNNGKELGKSLTEAFVHEVIIPQNDSMYYEFRKTIDKYLNETKEYSTTEQEINRFKTNTPQEGYILAPHLMGDMKKRGTIIY